MLSAVGLHIQPAQSQQISSIRELGAHWRATRVRRLAAVATGPGQTYDASYSIRVPYAELDLRVHVLGEFSVL